MNKKQIQIYSLLLTFFFNLSFCQIVNCQSFAEQNLTEKVALSKILKELKQQKNITFLYEPETIEDIFIETDFSLNEEVKTILKSILPSVGLKFKKVGKYNFVIKKGKHFYKKGKIHFNKNPKKNYSTKKIKTVNPQQISGKLFDEENGEVLIGATILLKNTAIGTTTNEWGEYQLKIPAGTEILVCNYLGYEEKEIEITGQKKQNIALKSATTDLNEVIVMAMGIEGNKRILGYAADNFQMEELSRAGESNLVSALTGKSAGVWVNTSSGSPGASASITIRGLRSINGSNKPLFILDGIPIDNTTTGNETGGVDVSNRLIDLNTHDIEKVTILKGAAATALYGIRAANGAIVMTSKKGGQGAPVVNFSTSFGLNEVNKLPPQQRLYAQGKYSEGQAVYASPETKISSSYGALVSELEFDGDTNYPYDKNGRLVAKGQGNGTPAKVYDAYETFFLKGRTLDNHLSVAGGTNWFNYYLSFGQFRETGVVPRSTFDRYSLKGVFQIQLQEKLGVTIASNLVNSRGFRMKRGSLFSGVPLGLYRNPITFDIGNGKKGKDAANSPETYIFENGTQRGFRGNARYDNPFWSVNRNPFEDNVNRLIQNVGVDYQLTPWLKAVYKVGLDVYSDRRKNAYDINSGSFKKGQIELFDIQSNNINSDFLLTIEQRLSDDWHFRAVLGHNYYTSEFSMKETTGEELNKQGLYQISNALYSSTEESLLRKKVVGIYGDLHLRFQHILYINLTGRNDWSSTLPPERNSFFYPSLSLGFEFTELLGWTDSPYLSFGKLRFSVSKVGNDANNYLTNTYFRPAVVNGDDLLPNLKFPAFGINAFERSGVLGNPNLKPETTTAYEIGADIKLFRGRFQLDVAAYKSIHKDQIVNAQLSATSGALAVPVNLGIIKNQGLEISVKINPVRKKYFRWDVFANFSTFKSIVADLSDNSSGIVLGSFTTFSSMILEGQPYGVFVGTSIKRDAQGRQVIDQDGFPMVNETQTIIGDPNPDWLLGIRNDFTWKKFTLSALLDVREGGDIWNGTQGVLSYLGISKISGDERNITNYIFDGVTETGEPNTIPVDFANPENGMEGIYWRRYGFLGLAENHVEDGSWVRLRELSLGYQFSPKWFAKKSPTITVAISGHNVFLITKYTGVDPETNLRGDSKILGWDYFTMPSTRGWSVELNAKF